MNKKNISLSVGVIVVLVIVFYAGASYGKGQASTNTTKQFSSTGFTSRNRTAGSGAGFIVGNILSKDANSMTISENSGGSKIIFFDNATKISKMVDGTTADLTVGTQVNISGATNPDGSESAETIQIRPNIPEGAKVQ